MVGFDFGYFPPPGTGTGHTHYAFYGWLDADESTDGSTYVDITLDSVVKNGFTHTNGNANVEIDNDGLYLVMWYVTTDMNIYNNAVRGRIELDSGGGYSAITGAFMDHAAQQVTSGNDAKNFFLSNFDAGDEIKLAAAIATADAESTYKAAKARLIIIWLGEQV